MSKTLRMQVKINAPAERVYTALTSTTALETWLAESAEVDLSANKFQFWGKYMPATPAKDSGHMAFISTKPNRQLKFRWTIGTQETSVEFKLLSRNELTILTLIQERGETGHHQQQVNHEDYWFLQLENLRRYLDGKPSDARVDFSQPMQGNVLHMLESDASPEEIYAALTDPELLERWIASDAKVKAEIGADYDIGWGIPIKIVDLIENQKIATKWSEVDAEGKESSTIVTWTLEASGGKTRITLFHSGFADDVDNSGIWAGWMNFLNWLRSVAEYGKDWQPPLVQIANSDYYAAYPKAIADAQRELLGLDA